MNYNEEGTKVGGSTGQCGNPDDSWYEGQRNHKRLQEAVVHKLRFSKQPEDCLAKHRVQELGARRQH